MEKRRAPLLLSGYLSPQRPTQASAATDARLQVLAARASSLPKREAVGRVLPAHRKSPILHGQALGGKLGGDPAPFNRDLIRWLDGGDRPPASGHHAHARDLPGLAVSALAHNAWIFPLPETTNEMLKAIGGPCPRWRLIRESGQISDLYGRRTPCYNIRIIQRTNIGGAQR
jgi:hypothetical protein